MFELKICGIKDEDNAQHISALNVDYLGLIFAKSPREVSREKAKNIAQIVHRNGKKIVGVFVEKTLDCILETVDFVELDGVQIYKKINKNEFESLKALGIFVWQVISVGENLEFPQELYADMVLFDTKGKFQGGNGISFNWQLLTSYKKDFILAGGIGLDNIKEALKFKPKIIDINSKVENEQGLKDEEKIRQILKEIGK
ncbi:phosphoribosylanthranilate isomerase [Campylobacter sp. MIT 21-1685]|uniref:phosphoribosylanthranilate isomerase n=1 Tax=unclassified Campylobacter TaxID=2593542 RepID=UPI00224AA4AD|nr:MULTISPECIES: phosphoribosylanthranilate isomerase [unclassified Campylobacter]MCX2683476.1 phosphoribosylanthranilate isomerase [Campylobacter sp. MIT 21-1684]MCX2751757.1 phosphoribosylanthranilate isomerase [Campylobacter sp. MIT 21-1682]MCX2807958.1 phosphoribosylanthranilate isomerase [Campylobacter sp. MIT 21-1685]